MLVKQPDGNICVIRADDLFRMLIIRPSPYLLFSSGVIKYMKKLYKLSQDVNNGYDTYDSVIVCADSEQEARKIHPSRFVTHMKDGMWYGTRIDGSEYETENSCGTWVSYKDLDKIKVEWIGDADDSVEYGVVLASFNAG